MNLKHLIGLGSMVVAFPVIAAGCGAKDALCCTDYQPGSNMLNVDFGVSADIKGQFAATAQAAGDLSVTADGLLTDVGNACRGIAIDLGNAGVAGITPVSQTTQTDNDGKTPQESVKAWCGLAADSLGKAITTLNLKLQFDAQVKCEASVSAQANCEASCSADVSCKANAEPPKCTGGTLEVSCSGKCDLSPGQVSMQCTGKCGGSCSGSCSGPSVECNAKCDGTCTAGGMAGGTGIQADGTCKGICNGTCEVKGGSCNAQCSGSCTASCEATATAPSVKCDGSCSAKAEPISCRGGKLEVACKASAECKANCNASVQAKASCDPPQIRFEGSVNSGAGAAIKAIQTHLPMLLVAAKARGEAFGTLVANFSGGISASLKGDLGVKGAACLASMIETTGDAAVNAKVGIEGSVGVVGKAGSGS
jgi:hypothetical protein